MLTSSRRATIATLCLRVRMPPSALKIIATGQVTRRLSAEEGGTTSAIPVEDPPAFSAVYVQLSDVWSR